MSTLGPDNSEIVASAGKPAAKPPQETFLEFARRTVREAFFDEPDVTDDPPATVTSITEAPSRRKEQAAAEAIASAKAARLEEARAVLNGQPASGDAEDNVADIAEHPRYHRVQKALDDVDIARATMPTAEPSQIEDLFKT